MARRVIGELVAKLEMDSTDFVRDAKGAERATADMAGGMDRDFTQATAATTGLSAALGAGLGGTAINSLKRARAETIAVSTATGLLVRRMIKAGHTSEAVYERIMRDVNQTSGRMAGLVTRVRAFAKGLTLTRVALGGFAVASTGAVASLAKLNSMARMSGEALNEMRNQAAGVSVAVDEFQKWSNFLGTAGLRGDDFNDILNEISVKLGDVEKGLSGPTEAVTFFGLEWKDANGNIRESIDLLPELLESIDRLGGASPRVRHELDALLGGDIARRALPLLAMEKDRREEILALAARGVVAQRDLNALANAHVDDLLRTAEHQARLNEATAAWLPILETAREVWHTISLGVANAVQNIGRALTGGFTNQRIFNLEVIDEQIAELEERLGPGGIRGAARARARERLAELQSLRTNLASGLELAKKLQEELDSLEAEVPVVLIPPTPDELATVLPSDFFGENMARAARERFARTQTRLIEEDREQRRQAAEEAEAFARAQAALELRLAESVRLESIKQLEQMKTAWQDVGTTIGGLITQTRSWGDLLRNIVGLAAEFAGFLAGGGEGGIRGFFNFPGLQYGGPVTSGSPHIVGERGPELFIPSSAGRIERNEALGGGPQAQTVNVYVDGNPDANSLVATLDNYFRTEWRADFNNMQRG